ncbi:MAG: glycosyltransferase family 2 protein [Dechloromonas sp.]|nr:glycosyltransferase family 2 protein [Dechloromonas sp.]
MLRFLRKRLIRAEVRGAGAVASTGRHAEAETASHSGSGADDARPETLARLAQAQGAWPQAAKHWAECLAAPGAGARIDWALEAVAVAGRLDDLDGAERLLETAAAVFPDRVEPRAGLARVAATRGLHRDAAERWDAVAARFAGAMTTGDRIAHVTALMHCGRFAEADTAATALMRDHPGRMDVRRLHARIASARLDEAAARMRWSAVSRAFPDATGRLPEYRRLRSLWDDDYSVLGESGEGAADALFRLRMLQAYQFSDEAAAAARRCVDAYPDELEIQLAALRALQGSAALRADFEEARSLATVLRERFGGSRQARVAELQLSVRLRDADFVASAVAGFTERFGDGAELLPFRSWLAQAGGDHGAARLLEAADIAQRFIPALREDLPMPRPIGPREAPALRDRIIVLTHARNEIGLVTWFLDYYRRLGVDWFHVVDDGSIDGTTEVLLAQPDVTVYRSDALFPMTSGGSLWMNQLLELHGADNWCIVVDFDEQLVMPELQNRSLRSILDEMAAKGEHAMAGFMLDMFPESIDAAAGFGPGDDPLDASPWFDTDYVFPGHWQAPYSWASGGARSRLFGQRHNCMAKTPIVRGGAGVRLLWKHHVTATRPSARSCALLHYKILQNVMRLRHRDPAEGQHVMDNLWLGRRHRADRIADVISHLSADDRLVGPGSMRFRGAQELGRLGLLPHLGTIDGRSDPAAERDGATDEPVSEAVRAAVSALRRHQWHEAAARWRACLSRQDAAARPLWHARHGLACLRLGETETARTAFETALAQGGAVEDLAEGLSPGEAASVGLAVR